ncbi:hypothetical protein [Nostoc sp.]|uniref:hypothetical protein n=1 Tax=Nostoc sp. TaxID=1180 RepID=UPI002FF6319C
MSAHKLGCPSQRDLSRKQRDFLKSDKKRAIAKTSILILSLTAAVHEHFYTSALSSPAFCDN